MGCRLCDPGRVLWETSSCRILEGSPYFKGHTIVALKRHVTRLDELSPGEYRDFFRALRKASRAVRDSLHPDKLNYALYGNWLPHLHWHIYPRFRDDPDWGQPPAIPWKVEGERVAPESIPPEDRLLTSEEREALKKALGARFNGK